MRDFTINAARIGRGQPCYVIAEAGVNHNGDRAVAQQLVDVAVAAGADAVKFQTFRAELLASRHAPKAKYQLETTDPSESQIAMLRKLELKDEEYRELRDYCAKRGITFLSTPFDETTADFLDSLDVPAFKIPSGEITNIPYLRHVAAKRKPMIVSTGMSHLGEVESAICAIEDVGNIPLALLHCTSNYPAPMHEVNLRAMRTMERAFGYSVGYSDHTVGIEISIAAAAMGACIIEKHFTLDRTMNGPDHRASLEPNELAAMVAAIRNVSTALGDGRKQPAASENATAAVARKSIVAARDIPVGAVIREEMLAIRRPGSGLPPSMLEYVVGRTSRIAITEGELLSFENVN